MTRASTEDLRTVYAEKSPNGVAYYGPVLVGLSTIAEASSRPESVRDVLRVLERLEPDDYTRYLDGYYRSGLERFGDAWRYADICTVLLAAAKILAPRTYLEIGVRRGRSMAMVVSQSPTTALVGFDLWVENYGNMENPGADFVEREMKRLGHRGSLALVGGNSHVTVPDYLSAHPDATFDLITVDGDHSPEGALADLRTVLPRLSLGGVIVFDDVVHPAHPELSEIWNRAVAEDGGIASHEFADLGYGVALGLRTRPRDGAVGRTRAMAQVRASLRRIRRRIAG